MTSASRSFPPTCPPALHHPNALGRRLQATGKSGRGLTLTADATARLGDWLVRAADCPGRGAHLDAGAAQFAMTAAADIPPADPDLRDLLENAPHTNPLPAAEAGVCAAYQLGRAVATLIVWSETWDDAGMVYGTILTPDESEVALTLQYRVDESDAGTLEVAVACPYETGCGPAWQTVNGRSDLLAALNGEATAPWCAHHGNGEA